VIETYRSLRLASVRCQDFLLFISKFSRGEILQTAYVAALLGNDSLFVSALP
jgi:hypothetical protein